MYLHRKKTEQKRDRGWKIMWKSIKKMSCRTATKNKVKIDLYIQRTLKSFFWNFACLWNDMYVYWEKITTDFKNYLT